jgi:hypothetical protein
MTQKNAIFVSTRLTIVSHLRWTANNERNDWVISADLMGTRLLDTRPNTYTDFQLIILCLRMASKCHKPLLHVMDGNWTKQANWAIPCMKGLLPTDITKLYIQTKQRKSSNYNGVERQTWQKSSSLLAYTAWFKRCTTSDSNCKLDAGMYDVIQKGDKETRCGVMHLHNCTTASIYICLRSKNLSSLPNHAVNKILPSHFIWRMRIAIHVIIWTRTVNRMSAVTVR